MINILSVSDEGLRPAEDIIRDLIQNPHKLTQETILDISDWQEETHEALWFRVKQRYWFIEWGHDSEGDSCKIVACFFRAYPLRQIEEISNEQRDGLNEILRTARIQIMRELVGIYPEPIFLEVFPIPTWMEEIQWEMLS
jgi:hypothetical protein